MAPAKQTALPVDFGDMRERKQIVQVRSPVTAKQATRRSGSTETIGGHLRLQYPCASGTLDENGNPRAAWQDWAAALPMKAERMRRRCAAGLPPDAACRDAAAAAKSLRVGASSTRRPA